MLPPRSRSDSPPSPHSRSSFLPRKSSVHSLAYLGSKLLPVDIAILRSQPPWPAQQPHCQLVPGLWVRQPRDWHRDMLVQERFGVVVVCDESDRASDEDGGREEAPRGRLARRSESTRHRRSRRLRRSPCERSGYCVEQSHVAGMLIGAIPRDFRNLPGLAGVGTGKVNQR